MTEEAVRALIRGFLKKNNLYDSYPVNLNKIADIVGASIFFHYLPEKISGFVLQGNNKDYPYIIGVNKSKHYHHQRFTIAHELSHVILRHIERKKSLMDSSNIYNLSFIDKGIEREANIGASELLVPTDKLKKILFNNFSIETAAKFFMVSKKVIEYRIKEVNSYLPL